MKGSLNHIAIAVKDAEASAKVYADAFKAVLSAPQILPEHGVKVVFADMFGVRIEFLEPLDEKSPIYSFTEKHVAGGIHHVCFNAPDFDGTIAHIAENFGEKALLGGGQPKIGAHGHPVVFLHPQIFCGALIELEKESS